MKIIKKITGNYLNTNKADVLAQEIVDQNLKILCHIYLQIISVPRVDIALLCSDNLEGYKLDEIHSKYESKYNPNKDIAGTISIYARAICHYVKNDKKKFEENVLRALCHELIHFRQELSTGVNFYKYTKTLFKEGLYDFETYYNDPYEVEARDMENKLYDLIAFENSYGVYYKTEQDKICELSNSNKGVIF